LVGQGPLVKVRTPALLAAHGLAYVWPLHPHTGLYSIVQIPFGLTLAGSMHSAVDSGVAMVGGRWQALVSRASPSSERERRWSIVGISEGKVTTERQQPILVILAENLTPIPNPVLSAPYSSLLIAGRHRLASN
jgi:hypothetical protein